jgi:hypothetical protein
MEDVKVMAQWCFCVASLFFYGLATFLFFTGVQAFAPGVVPYNLKIQIRSTTT